MTHDVDQCVENALNVLVSVTDKSGNLRNDLRRDILNSVSELRKSFMELKSEAEERETVIRRLEEEVKKLGGQCTAAASREAEEVSQSLNVKRNYRAALRGDRTENIDKRYKILIKSKMNESTEAMKVILKRKINPTQLKVGINSMKTLRDGRLIIESGSKSEIELLGKTIEEKCSQQLEVNVPKLRNPNVIIYNIPEEISIENAAEIISSQNGERNVSENSIRPKFIMTNRRNTRHLVAEVNPETWRNIVQRKLKIGWQICNVEDYVKINRCFKCSKFNHRAEECKGEETCPLCTGTHKLKECKATQNELKCITCVTHNKYNKNDKVCENHSSLDKNCPGLQSIIRKYRQNTEY